MANQEIDFFTAARSFNEAYNAANPEKSFSVQYGHDPVGRKYTFSFHESATWKIEQSCLDFFKQVQDQWNKTNGAEWNRLKLADKKALVLASQNYKKIAQIDAEWQSWSWKKIIICITICLTGFGIMPVLIYCLVKKNAADYVHEMTAWGAGITEKITQECPPHFQKS